MSSLVLDAGAFVAVERGDRSIVARLEAAQLDAVQFRTSAIAIAQVWRDPMGRQANLARLLRSVDVRSVDQPLAREAGILLGRTGMSDTVDATVVLVAEDGDIILTSDPRDIARLAAAAERRVLVIAC